MRRLAAALAPTLVLLLLAACSQQTQPPTSFDPVGTWTGTWKGPVTEPSLTVTFEATADHWRGAFTTAGVTILTICTNHANRGTAYLHCESSTATAVYTWAGYVDGDEWPGTWRYVTSLDNLAGTFELVRQEP